MELRQTFGTADAVGNFTVGVTNERWLLDFSVLCTSELVPPCAV
jgi:hypothetical protein